MDQETITKPVDRVSIIPIDNKYRAIWENYQLQQKSVWLASSIYTTTDYKTYPTLPTDIQLSLKYILGFFAGSDEIVNQNLVDRFLQEITIPEIRYNYAHQAMMENVHSETYGMLIDGILPDGEKKMCFNAIRTLNSVKRKADWATRWISSDKPFSHRCIAFACVEGIMFSASFAFIDWMKSAGYVMEGLYQSNDYISRDEASHNKSSYIVYSYIDNRVPQDIVKEIIDEAISAELLYAKEVLPNNYNGMNYNMMSQHIRHVANITATSLGYDNIYGNTSSPFTFSNIRSVDTKPNFFEVHNTQYNTCSDYGAPFDTTNVNWDSDSE